MSSHAAMDFSPFSGRFAVRLSKHMSNLRAGFKVVHSNRSQSADVESVVIKVLSKY